MKSKSNDAHKFYFAWHSRICIFSSMYILDIFLLLSICWFLIFAFCDFVIWHFSLSIFGNTQFMTMVIKARYARETTSQTNLTQVSVCSTFLSLSMCGCVNMSVAVCVCVCVVSWSVFLHKLQLTFCDTCEPHIYWLLLPLPLPLLWLWLLFCIARRHACCVNKRTQPGKKSTDSLYTCVYK